LRLAKQLLLHGTSKSVDVMIEVAALHASISLSREAPAGMAGASFFDNSVIRDLPSNQLGALFQFIIAVNCGGRTPWRSQGGHPPS
jgi:uncharacterized protein with beta-barrel porin domain